MKIDHFSIGCQTLGAGVAEMSETLGVTVPQGSKHESMSTHNCVMQAGKESFFELIATDPDAPKPGRPRWFSLDDPATSTKIAERARALAWVVNTDDLDALVAASPVDLGEIVHFTRGTRSWRLTVPADGGLVEGGTIPGFIEWSPGPHPSSGQVDLGVRLQQVCLRHPDPAWLEGVLSALSIADLAKVAEGPAGVAFMLDTPRGNVVID